MIKRVLPLLLLLGFLLTPAPAPVQAQLSLGQLRTLIDTRLAALWQIILTRQTIHYLNYGHYFQGLLTHGTLPADGSSDYLDMQFSHPTDQHDTWVDFFDVDLPADLPMALEINVYEGPRGNGFQAVLWVSYGGEIYTRAKGVGPLSGLLTHDWRLWVNVP